MGWHDYRLRMQWEEDRKNLIKHEQIINEKVQEGEAYFHEPKSFVVRRNRVQKQARNSNVSTNKKVQKENKG